MSLSLPLPTVVHRLQRRHAIQRSPAATEHACSNAAQNATFSLPTVHVWCVRVAHSDRPHVVVFADEKDALATARAISSFTRSTRRVPQSEGDLRSLFGYHFKSLPAHTRAVRRSHQR